MEANLTPDPREAKLPKWAKWEMARLRRIAEQCEARIAEADKRAEEARLTTNPGECNTVLNPYGMRDDHIGLGNNTRVTFRLAEKTWRDEITVRLHPVWGYLEISGSRPLTIAPHVSNVFHVNIRKD